MSSFRNPSIIQEPTGSPGCCLAIARPTKDSLLASRAPIIIFGIFNSNSDSHSV
jgi:hypothetical protein